MAIIQQHPYWTLIITAFVLNIACGFIRQGWPKFSFKWFLWIHASIPVLIYLRISSGISGAFIPVTLMMAILGQIAGSRYRRKKMTVKDQEALEQIPDLLIPGEKLTVPTDPEVMIVLMNMGGPRTNAEVRPFLLRLFNDDLIIRFPLSAFLQSFFAWLLVKARGKATEERYQLIGGGSPILKATAKQAFALGKELKRRGRKIAVTFSFNYSWPLPEDTIRKVKREGKKYVLPLSLYPHYSAATTGSNIFYLKEESRKSYPEAVFFKTPSYYTHDSYIEAFVDRIRERIRPDENLDDFFILFSAHGLPLYFLTQGDPYPFQIAETVRKIVDRLERPGGWVVSYQSDVGPLQWIKPSTESMLHALARRGIKKLLVVPVSFVTDHIETSCEIDIEYRKVAEDLGITDFRMSRAIETHPGFIRALADAVETVLPAEHGVTAFEDRSVVTG